MNNIVSNSKRIAINTLMLYVRMFFILLISLYTSRVILKALGVEDYGIYNAVGGFVGMFAVISNSLSAAISRFITFELGKDNQRRINKIFSIAILMQLFISAILIFVSMTFGLWFLNTQMTIPADRFYAANWVFVISVLTFVINLISVPYNACIIAHEHMKAFAYVGIIEAVGKLIIAYIITESSIDNLILYAVLMCIFAVFIRFIYSWYCKRHFEECTFKFIFDKNIIREIFGFAGWNFIGSASGVLKDQGVNVLLNIFCGPTVNAARGIAIQISTAVTQFSQNFIVALNPQITKSYASNNHLYMMTLIEKGSKISYFMLFFLSLPILINTPYILKLWLGSYPIHTVAFVRLIICLIMHDSISSTLITAMLATGNIRNYQILVGGILMMNLPISYIALHLGYPPETVIIVAIGISILCFATRIYMLRSMINLSARRFILNVYIRIILVSSISFIIPYLLYINYNASFKSFVINCIVCVASSSVCIYLLGCNKSERIFIISKVKNIKQINLK